MKTKVLKLCKTLDFSDWLIFIGLASLFLGVALFHSVGLAFAVDGAVLIGLGLYAAGSA